MNHHEIEKARRCLRTAGTVEDRAHIRQAAMARLRDEIEVTAQRKEAVKKDFRERLEKWETRTVPENAPVVARPGERHDNVAARIRSLHRARFRKPADDEILRHPRGMRHASARGIDRKTADGFRLFKS